MPHPSSPPPSPLGDCVAIRELQYSTHPAPTSSPACPDVAAVALSFGASVKKRNSQHHRDRAVAGIPSPMKKKVNFQPSPRRPAPIDDAAAASPMDASPIDVGVSSVLTDGDMPSPPVRTRKMPLGTIADFVLPSITPSPCAPAALRSITPSSGAPAAPAPPPTVAHSPNDPAQQIAVQTPAPKPKPKISKSKLMKLDNKFVLGARRTTFDASALRRDDFYSKD